MAAAMLLFIAAMAAGWLFRALVLRALRARHAQVFDELGRPTSRQLGSFTPRYREMQLRFWKYLWGGDVFRLDDPRTSTLAWCAVLSDIALMASMVAIFWSAAHLGA